VLDYKIDDEMPLEGMVVPPALEGSPRVIGMLAIDFDEIVQHPASKVQILVAKVLT